MDKSRQQFEEWFATQREEMKNNGLGMMHINRMYQRQLSAWQASRDSLNVELPKEQKVKAYDFYTDGYNSGIDCCEFRLESMGIKVIRGR
ncbi:hypothetical protein [Providencia rettgeri]|uniref:hypothetical protein n=1 Tax=Providencia rettgeri TaxID=587 RepID=UPI0023AABE42|nr:hypothetical protein [Providencia rettgeri]